MANQMQVRELPCSELARSMPAPERPKVFTLEGLAVSALPTMVPFAIIDCMSYTNAEWTAKLLRAEAVPLKPDVVLLQDAGKQYAGAVGVYWGFGISTAQPVYNRLFRATCFRLAPASIGALWNDLGMITLVVEGSAAQKSGLQEGDTLMSIDGIPVAHGEEALRSPHHAHLLGLEPGQILRFVWIRPGTGRMAGSGECTSNPPTHLDMPDSIPWDTDADEDDR